jgi:hypothetical protein
MTDDDLGTGELSSPAKNGATGDSASAISVPSNGGDKAIDGSDEKALSSVNFLIAEVNRLAEEISVRSNSGAKAADGSDEKALFTIKFLIAEINRLERTLYRHYDTLARFVVERN